jgi:NAD(P)-dependent dehydrogenase (short-subunit alcohol dehydrogenase family)
MNNKWTAADMPDLTGKLVAVTGGNSGIGFDAVRAFAQKGARTIMASRNPEKGAQALAEIQAELPTAPVELMELDLADLGAIHCFAAEFQERYAKLHILVNNAGVMALPYRTTADGFEMQFGTNKIGSNEASHDQAVARRLWAVSEELTGVQYSLLEN